MSCFPPVQIKVDLHPPDDVLAFLQAHNVDAGSTSDVYVLCFYFICTVLTTTGFGDISAEDYPERIFMILLMSCASLLFGLVLGEVC